MRLQRIVIGMDFSDTALSAAAWVRTLAPDADCVLVHAIERADRPSFFTRGIPAEEIEHAARDFAERRMAELTTSFGEPTPRTVIRVGPASTVVSNVAREERATLIVIGPHGDRPRPSRFLGTAADRIVRVAPCSVLVATDTGHAPPRRILVPIDDADITPTVLAWVRDLANQWNADVTLLHVWSNAIYSHVASMAHATADDEHEAREDIRNELDAEATRWLERMVATGLHRDRVDAIVRHGKAGDVVLEVANDSGAEMIVMGRQGSGLVAPALLGSTVGTVLSGARCAVLVVAETATEKA